MKIIEAAKEGWKKGVERAKEEISKRRNMTIAEKKSAETKKESEDKDVEATTSEVTKPAKVDPVIEWKREKDTKKVTPPPVHTTPKTTTPVTKSTGGELSKVVKVVEPDLGSKVTFQIFMKQPGLQYCIDQIVAMARVMNATSTVDGDKVTVCCPNEETAERLKKYWN